eukprot:GHVU01127285.1.p1 GENE.GHVU01127285.1~~GHVU01127285.1.p1  ORF type:complete len:496 (-),score=78.39 GHVU01127285.1:369-1856(-)
MHMTIRSNRTSWTISTITSEIFFPPTAYAQPRQHEQPQQQQEPPQPQQTQQNEQTQQTQRQQGPPQPQQTQQNEHTQQTQRQQGPPQEDADLDSLPADVIRRLCTSEGVEGRRDGKKRKSKPELIDLLRAHRKKRQQLQAAAAVVTPPRACEAAPSSSSSSGIPGVANEGGDADSKHSLVIRLLNTLFKESNRDAFARIGDKPTRAAFDERQTGAAAPFWVRVARDFNKSTADPELDHFVPRVEDGVHSFLGRLAIPMGPLLKHDYSPAELHAKWKTLQRNYRQKHANFNQSGNHNQFEEDFAKFLHRTDAGVFYLFQWLVVYPDFEDFVLSTMPSVVTSHRGQPATAKARKDKGDIATAMMEDTEVQRQDSDRRHMEEMQRLALEKPRVECEYLGGLMGLQRKCIADIAATTGTIQQMAAAGVDDRVVQEQLKAYEQLLVHLRGRVSSVVDGSWSRTETHVTTNASGSRTGGVGIPDSTDDDDDNDYVPGPANE